MNDEFEELIASFRIADDLEAAVESSIRGRIEEFSATPLTSLPLGHDDDLVEQHSTFRVKRVESRVIPRLKAA